MSAHKTSASALAPPKPTSHALVEQPLTSSTKKRKKKDDLVIAAETDPNDAGAGSGWSTKKAKLGIYDDSDVGSTPAIKLKSEKKKKTKRLIPEVVKTGGKFEEKEAVIEKKGKKKQAAEPVISEDEDEDEAVEGSEQNPPSSGSEENDGEYVPPVHESLSGATVPDSTSSSKKNKKYVPSDETPGQRDSRTIFIGNVPSQVMATKVSRVTGANPRCSWSDSLMSIVFAQAIQTPHPIIRPHSQNRIRPLPFNRLPKTNCQTTRRD